MLSNADNDHYREFVKMSSISADEKLSLQKFLLALRIIDFVLKCLNILHMGMSPGKNWVNELVVEWVTKVGKCHFLPIEKFAA